MYIKQIELENFKSFNKKTTIDFHKGFNTIIGKNGVGKTNILDSINFVYNKKDLRIKNKLSFFNSSSNSLKSTVKIVFDNNNTVEKIFKKDSENYVKNALYYFNGKRISKDKVLDFLKEVNLKIIDNCGCRFSQAECIEHAKLLKEKSKKEQIIVVSLRKEFIEIADRIIRVDTDKGIVSRKDN